MNTVRGYFSELKSSARDAWNRFWFTPTDPATLSLIRILAGGMLLYTHLVWSLGLESFFGRHAWTNSDVASRVQGSTAWSYFWWIDSTAMLWTVHVAGLVIFACLMLGLCSRVMAVLAYLVAVAYVHRVPGALFGLDQINVMLAMYLMVGPCGGAYSLDRWMARRRAQQPLPPAAPSVSANLAIRLMQFHMCVIYFFAGLAKLQGDTWWSGTALWGAIANLEYQSLDVTWLASYPLLLALMTQVTVWWELSFCVLVWPRLARPLVLLLAIPLHLGIAFCMGMITFGLVMLIGCLSFVSPALVRRLLDKPSPVIAKAGQGGAAEPATDPARHATRHARRSASISASQRGASVT